MSAIWTDDEWIEKCVEAQRLREINADLLAALESAMSCGMVPASSVSDGGANRHSEQVRVADIIRAAISKAKTSP